MANMLNHWIPDEYTLLENYFTNKDGVQVKIYKSKSFNENDSEIIRYILVGVNNEYYGEILLKHSNEDKAYEAEVEYYADIAQKNKGNVSVGLIFVLEDIFKHSDINNVYLNIAPSNIASQKVAEKCGFKKRVDSRRYYDLSKKGFLEIINGVNSNVNEKNSDVSSNMDDTEALIDTDSKEQELSVIQKRKELYVQMKKTAELTQKSSELFYQQMRKDYDMSHTIENYDINKYCDVDRSSRSK